MCHRVVCPNDGKPTWWGCGQHIESALAGVPPSERCTCPHERVPYLPVMQRVKRRNVRVEMGSSDDVDVVVSAQTVAGSSASSSPTSPAGGSAATLVIAIAPHRQKHECTLNLELDLPSTITMDAEAAKDPPAGMQITSVGEKSRTLAMSIVPPATALELALQLPRPVGDNPVTIFGLEGGNLRRQWVCPHSAGQTPMEDIHARLAVKPATSSGSGFGLGGDIEPTLVVAVLVFVWVIYNFVFAGGGRGAAERGKRE